MSFVLSLDEIRDSHRPLVGGKGFALADMFSRDMSVPPALCVTTEAYTEYLAAAGLQARIRTELDRKPFGEMRWEELWDAALRIENLFLNTPLPGKLHETLYGAVRDAFGDKAVVVRSSALGEDTSATSFAGLHESYVNVKGTPAVLDHVRRVWASLWSDRALLYRQELNLQLHHSAMAVVIQEMVNGERSGVVFGRSPNDPSQTVVEAVYGLNQGLVDGTVMPDRWILDRDTGRLVSHRPGDREHAVVPGPGGVQLEALPAGMMDYAPLSEEDIKEVFNLSQVTEQAFGEPQDVEWTFRGDRLYILQARPVTSPLSGSDDDKRPWYLSLRKSFETLKRLRRQIEEERIPQMKAEAIRLAVQDLESLSDGDLTEEIERRSKIDQNWARIYEEEFIPMAHGMRLFGQVYNSTVRPADPYEFMSLLGTSDMVSLRRNGMLEALSEMVRQDPALSSHLKVSGTSTGYEAFQKLLVDFTEAFGDLSCGTDQCVTGQHAIIKLVLEMARRPPERYKGPKRNFQRLKEEFFARFPSDQRPYAEALLDIGRASYRLRDDDNIYVGKIRGQLDRAVREGLDRVEEAEKTGGVMKRASRRLAEVVKRHARLSQNAGGVASSADAGPLAGVRQLVGQPAGPGIGSGVAQVITDTSELFDFEAGKILVCDALDPAMTFVVPLCEGIVERRGGMLIHGAIIAREYGLPCVTGVPDAASVIETGDRITVDGYLGIVTIHPDAGD